MVDNREMVQEVLCLLLGDNGKYFHFDQRKLFQLIECETGIVERNELQPPVMALIRRLASIGHYYNQINLAEKRLSNIASTGGMDLFRPTLGQAYRKQMIAYFRLVTELHITQPTLFTLHAKHNDLMNQFDCLYELTKVPLTGVPLLNRLFDKCHHGNEAISGTATLLFTATLRPLLTHIGDWLVQKQPHSFPGSFFLTKVEQRFKISQSKATFLSKSAQKLILRFGIVMGFFIDIATREQINLIQTQLTHLVQLLASLNVRNKVKINLEFECGLLAIYHHINRIILDTFDDRDAELSKTLSLIQRFLFLSSVDDVSESVSTTVGPKFSRRTTFGFSIRRKPSETELLTTGAITNANQIMLDVHCQHGYRQLRASFSNIKKTETALRQLWKQLQLFHNDLCVKWEYNITPIVRKICLKTNQLIWVIFNKKCEISSVLTAKWNTFMADIHRQHDILHLKPIHRKFLQQIETQVNEIMNDKSYRAMEMTVPELKSRVVKFIGQTRQAYEFENGQWYDEKLKNRKNYSEKLCELSFYLDCI